MKMGPFEWVTEYEVLEMLKKMTANFIINLRMKSFPYVDFLRLLIGAVRDKRESKPLLKIY